MLYNLPWLVQRYEEQQNLKYVFFWGHRKNPNGLTTKSCFSQWWEQDFVVEDHLYRTAEHWMMAQKARLFQDQKALESILKAITPGEAKKLGRQVRGFDATIWNTHKFDIVVQGNRHKFSQAPDLKDFLLNTKDRILVEASPHDKIWGIGLAAQAEGIENPYNWKGENLLGFALMQVRDQLAGE